MNGGLNDSPEDFHQGFTHCYMLTFHSEKDRDSIYTPHAKHQEFVASLQPFVRKGICCRLLGEIEQVKSIQPEFHK